MKEDELIVSVMLIIGGIIGIAEGYHIATNPDWVTLLSPEFQSTIKNLIDTPIIGSLFELMISSPTFMEFAGLVFVVIGFIWAVSLFGDKK